MNADGTITVRWVDNSVAKAWPHHLFRIEEVSLNWLLAWEFKFYRPRTTKLSVFFINLPVNLRFEYCLLNVLFAQVSFLFVYICIQSTSPKSNLWGPHKSC